MDSRKLAAACAIAATTIVPALPVASAQARTSSRHATGWVQSADGYYLTIKLHGHARGVLAAMTRAANRITAHDYPYVWGGGHGQAGVASVGVRGGPGHNGKRKGFDCSGSVAAVLVAGGLWPQGAGVPSDAGVIAELRAQHLIARGAGVGPREVTLYDYPGVHIFMNIDGRFFGTSDGAGGANRRGGPGWLNDGAWDLHNRHFKRWHILPSVLRSRTNAGLLLTFSTGGNWTLLQGLGVRDRVSVQYTTSRFGTMVAQAVKLRHQRTLSGTVSTLSAATLTVTLANGQTRELTVASGVPVDGVQVGDGVSVTYTRRRTHGTVVFEAHAIKVTATPAPPPSGTGTTGTSGTTTTGTTGTGTTGTTGTSGTGSYGYSTTGGGTSISQTPPDGGYSLTG